jgi:hypothetical protein
MLKINWALKKIKREVLTAVNEKFICDASCFYICAFSRLPPSEGVRAGERVGGLNWSEKSLPRPDTWMIFYLSRSWKGLALIDGRKHTYSLAHTHARARRLRKWGCNGVTLALFAEVNNSTLPESEKSRLISMGWLNYAWLFNGKQILVLHVREKPLDWFTLLARDGDQSLILYVFTFEIVWTCNFLGKHNNIIRNSHFRWLAMFCGLHTTC